MRAAYPHGEVNLQAEGVPAPALAAALAISIASGLSLVQHLVDRAVPLIHHIVALDSVEDDFEIFARRTGLKVLIASTQ
jgi:hypothetical protein